MELNMDILYSTIWFPDLRIQLMCFFFLLNLLTSLFIILGLNVLGDKVNFELSIIIYYLLFWSGSLNVMRQSLAASIVFLLFHYI